LSTLKKLLAAGSLAVGTLAVAVPAVEAQVPAPPATFSLAASQTGIRNQQDRGTCTGFAMVAAIEARYRRQWNRTLDLSEDYYWHVYKSTGVDRPRTYKYENQSSFWGGGSIRGLEAARTYGIPVQTDMANRNGTQMDTLRASIPAAGGLVWNGNPALNTVTQAQVDAFEYSTSYVPAAARQNARYGVSAFTNHPGGTERDTDALERIISGGREVLIGLDLHWSWNAARTIRVYDAAVNEGQHAFLLVGYDRTAQTFLVKNSWNDGGLIRVHYDVLRNSAYEASSIDSVPDPNTFSSTKGRYLGNWNLDFDGWRGKMTVRRSTDTGNGTTRLGHFLQDGATEPMAVNGSTYDSGRGLQFSVESSNDAPLDQQQGTRQFVEHGTKSAKFASGINLWSNIQFGTLLSRDPVAGKAGSWSADKWVGNWKLVDDGAAAGTLKITGVGAPDGDGHRTVTGSFTTTLGASRTITASTTADHALTVAVNSSAGAKSYNLWAHPRETNVVSGAASPIGSFDRYEAHALRA
jgi:hypothetical protein